MMIAYKIKNLFISCIVLISLIGGFIIGVGYARFVPVITNLPDLRQSQYISISDGWTGLAKYSPLERSFFLHRQGEYFIGNGTIRVGGDYVHSSTSYLSIEIPNDDIERAIEILSKAKITSGLYEPVIISEDDYPYIKLGFIAEGERVEFYTSSQSAWTHPWACMINNQEYITASGEPYEAFLILRKYLRDDLQDTLKGLKNKY
jgi:hypothetical protein